MRYRTTLVYSWLVSPVVTLYLVAAKNSICWASRFSPWACSSGRRGSVRHYDKSSTAYPLPTRLFTSHRGALVPGATFWERSRSESIPSLLGSHPLGPTGFGMFWSASCWPSLCLTRESQHLLSTTAGRCPRNGERMVATSQTSSNGSIVFVFRRGQSSHQ